jgi:hypothetical protein
MSQNIIKKVFFLKTYMCARLQQNITFWSNLRVFMNSVRWIITIEDKMKGILKKLKALSWQDSIRR